MVGGALLGACPARSVGGTTKLLFCHASDNGLAALSTTPLEEAPMTNQMYVAPVRLRRPGPLFLIPLLIIPLVIYNLVAFIFFAGKPIGWNNQLFAIFMASGAPWVLTLSDLMVVVGLVCLFFEIMKSTRIGSSSIFEHILSTGVFILFLIEFILVGAAASSAFFILMVMSLIDVIAGFSVSMSAAERDVNYN
jgi:hypothetical protein